MCHEEEQLIRKYIDFCHDYSNATLIPTSLRDKSVALYSSQGEAMGLSHSREPDAYLYNPYRNGPEFCSGHPNIQYGRIPVNDTNLDIYIGPIFPTGITEELFDYLMREQVISAEHRDDLKEYIMHIPNITRSQLAQHMVLINNCVNETKISYESIYGIHPEDILPSKVFHIESDDEVTADLFSYEKQLYHIVSSGNITSLKDYLCTFTDDSMYVGKLASSELRHYKNLFIVAASNLCSMSAIPAGVSAVDASRLTNLYIKSCENLRTIEEVGTLLRTMFFDFCKLCGEASAPFKGNPELMKCIDFIRNHVNESISISDVAKHINRSDSYAMKLFRRELGITIGQFIMRCKLEEAKSLLTYTDMSLSEISHYLCFSSQSYFQNVFRKKYNITPDCYRKGNKECVS